MTNQILIVAISLILGCACGVIMHRSDFCLAGAIRDFFLFGNSPLFPSLILLITLNMIFFELARLSGFVVYELPSSLYGLPSLTTLFGGILFGIGMVLAGGCVVGVLYKAGAGSVSAFVAIVGLLIGSLLYVAIHPYWVSMAQLTRLSAVATVPQLLGLNQTMTLFWVVVALGFFLVRRHRQNMLVRPSFVKNYLQPWKAAVLLALVSLISFATVGMPLGITSSYSKVGTFIAQYFAPTWISAQEFLQVLGFAYYSPIADTILRAGPGPYLDGLSVVQFPLIAGIVLGSFGSCVQMKKFSLHWNIPVVQFLSAFSGGMLMGMASRMSPACNVWHLLGGIPLLSLQSLLFFVGLFPGAWIGTRLLTRLVVRVG